jgi:hypothetical protein
MRADASPLDVPSFIESVTPSLRASGLMGAAPGIPGRVL